MEVIWAALVVVLITALVEAMEALDWEMVMDLAMEEWEVLGGTSEI